MIGCRARVARSHLAGRHREGINHAKQRPASGICHRPPHSGGAVLAALFEANGYKWDHHKSGKLAQDLAYAQATGTMPFVGRESVVGFSDIYRMHKRHLPPLAVQDYLAFLLHQFPDAYFVNTRRDVADWIADRFWAEDGEHRIAAAWYAGIGEADLPQHWMTEDTQH